VGRNRRKFTPEFKAEAVALVEASGGNIAQVAKELGIYDSTHGQFLLLLDVGATSGTTTERVGAVLDRDDGKLQCTVTEDAPASSALAGPPTFAVDSQGDTRAADPGANLVTGGAEGNNAVVEFPYTRTNAVAHVTFTNGYAVVTTPTFTG
jgi:transposase-like protein